MRYDPKVEQFLRNYFDKTPAPWSIAFCVGDFGVSIAENDYGYFQFTANQYEIDRLAGRLNLVGKEGECSFLLSEFYLEENMPNENAFLATYNYAWAVLSENIEECPRWMIYVSKVETSQNMFIINQNKEQYRGK